MLFAAEKVVTQLSPKEQYLAGILILQRSSTAMSDEEVIDYYRLLQKVTGISTETGKKYLESFSQHPEKWAEELERIDAYYAYLAQSQGGTPDSTVITRKIFGK